MDPAIEVIGLTKSFGSGRALAGIDLTIGEGEMVALIGTSGSGKSTLLRHLAGFVAADQGMIRVLAETVQRDGRLARDIRRIRARIGFVFQQFNLVGRLPVITNVLCGQLHRTSIWRSMFMRFTDADRQQAIEALLSVGIEQKAWSRASTLSGGQQQRAAIARCLVQGARVILADEPIASLDPDSSRNVMEVLTRLNRERRCTVLVSLHQVEYAKRYCPRTIALRHGAVVFDGPSEYLTTELLAGVYGTDSLQDPPAARRSAIRPEAGADVATDPVAWPSSPSFQPTCCLRRPHEIHP